MLTAFPIPSGHLCPVGSFRVTWGIELPTASTGYVPAYQSVRSRAGLFAYLITSHLWSGDLTSGHSPADLLGRQQSVERSTPSGVLGGYPTSLGPPAPLEGGVRGGHRDVYLYDVAMSRPCSLTSLAGPARRALIRQKAS
jgi:hypothetical protein